jgi:hypothetical protein
MLNNDSFVIAVMSTLVYDESIMIIDNNHDMTDVATSVASKQPKTKRQFTKLKRFVSLLLVLMLITGTGTGVYWWQHRKVAAANVTIGSLENSVKTLNGQLTTLQAQYNKVTSELTDLRAPAGQQLDSITVTLNGASYVNPFGSGIGIGPTAYLGVDVTIKNPNSSTIYVSPQEFKLKGSQNETYQNFDPSGVQVSGLPAGYQPLTNQSLGPNEVVRGAIIFTLPNNSQYNFNLIHDEQSHAITVPKA